ncbi:LacI family DNA-binding transcriptional regulator [Nonomuraea sp. NPDC049152]|uniref:LacI family DNA-binding transcriptional regulator n=1 Tax=Nonomuraea sp. NPDC049152 TaxID=3154350 RepID=UPI0033D4A917
MADDKLTEPHRATSADVARLAGVSRATVSFVLNATQPQRVSQRTRERVLAAAEQLEYVPHAVARSLRAGHTNLVLVPTSVSAIGRLVSGWLEDLHSELHRLGYTVVMHGGRFADLESAARAWAEMRPTAIFALAEERFTPEVVQLLRRSGVRALFTYAAAPVPGAYTVLFDHAEIGAAAAEHLVDRGRRNIGVVMPQERGLEVFAKPRLTGVRRAAVARGASVTEVPLDYAEEAAADLADGWSKLGLDSVFAYNDEYAALLMRAFQDVGIDVPGEVAMVGADDLLLGRLQRPRLTSIRLDVPPSRLIAQTLTQLIETGTAPPLPPMTATLVAREST